MMLLSLLVTLLNLNTSSLYAQTNDFELDPTPTPQATPEMTKEELKAERKRKRQEFWKGVKEAFEDATSNTSGPEARPIEPEISKEQREECENKMDSLGITDTVILDECDDSKSFNSISTKAIFADCYKSLLALGQNERSSFESCHDSEDIKETNRMLKSESIVQCQKVLVDAKITDAPLALCGHYEQNFLRISNKTQFSSCLKKGVSGGYGDYYLMNLEAIQKVRTTSSESVYAQVVKDCMNEAGNLTKISESSPIVLAHTVFNHDQKTIEKIDVGGISGCFYVEQDQKAYCISDQKSDPRIYTVQVKKDEAGDWKFALDASISLSLNRLDDSKVDSTLSKFKQRRQSNSINRNVSLSDFEDIVITPDRRIVLSSELSNSDLADNGKEINYLTTFSFDGMLQSKAETVPEFSPKAEDVEITHHEREWVTDFSGKNGHWREYETYETKTVQTAGTRGNKGVEGMTLDPTGQFLFYANEQSLAQDLDRQAEKEHKSNWRNVRIVKQSTKEPKELQQFFYTLEEQNDNGLVAMAAFDAHRLLTLERSYTSSSNTLISKVFLVELVANGKPVGETKKRELFNLKDLLPQFSAGLRALDNFEAMSFGPKMDQDSFSLIFATDNNFVKKELSILMLVKVPKSLLLTE